jgi:hypothetical protein
MKRKKLQIQLKTDFVLLKQLEKKRSLRVFHKTVELDYNYLFLTTSQLQIFLKAHFSPNICCSTLDVNFRFFQRARTANGNRVKLRGIKISGRYSLK